MAYSFAQYVADGNTDIFNVPFPFITKAHVSVLVGGVDTPYTWHTTATIKLASKPAVGTIVRVKRTTPTDKPIATFVSGVPIPALDLNNTATQNIYALQEFLDNMAAQLAVNASNKWEGSGKVLTNLGDPVDPQDAATKAWVLTVPNTTLADGVAARDAAQAAQLASEAARDGAVNAKLAAQAEVGNLTPRVQGVENALPNKLDKSLFTAAWDFVVGSAAGAYVKKTLAEVQAQLLALVGGYTKQQYSVPVVLTGQSGAIALDADLHQDVDITATGNVTFSAPTNAVRGKTIFMTLYAATALTIGWNAVFAGNADLPTLDAAFVAGKRLYLQFRCIDGTNWVLMGRTQGA